MDLFAKVRHAVRSLTLLDMRVQYENGDSKDAVASAKALQGLVNRAGADKLYLLNDATDSTHDIGGREWNVQADWLEALPELAGLPQKILPRQPGADGGLHTLLEHYGKLLKGVVVWDDNPHKKVSMAAFGAAVTIASQTEGLAVSPDVYEELQAWGYAFPLLLDLRELGFTSDHALMDWCIDRYWEGSNHDLGCAFSLGMDGWAPHALWGDNWFSNTVFHEGPIDYAVAVNGFSFNLNVSDADDEHVLIKLLRKYPEGKTSVLGWIPAHPFGAGFSEVPPCLNATSYFVVGVNGFSNLSVFASCPNAETRRPVPRALPAGERDVFVNFLATDGDALHCVYRGMFSAFRRRDESFGKIPLTWTLNPVLAELAPPVFRFFLQNAPHGSDFAAAWADKINTVWDTGSDAMAETWKSYAELSGLRTIWTVESAEETQQADLCGWDSIIVGYLDSRVPARTSSRNHGTCVFGTWCFGSMSAEDIAGGILEYAKACREGPLFLTVPLGASFDEARSFYAKAEEIAARLGAAGEGRMYHFLNAGDMACTYRKFLQAEAKK